MKRFMVFVVSLAFLLCGSAFAAEKKAKEAKTEPAVATDTAAPEKEKKEKKATKKAPAKKEKKEKKDDAEKK